jgi:DNA-directed RNA polymerase subunit E'/Rpb7
MMDNNESTLYFVMDISTNIEIQPHLLNNSNIYNIIKNETKKQYEKKCSPYGYIDTIFKIIDYKNAYFVSENLNGNITYDITYTAKVCNPQINSIIECKVINLNKSLISCKNGPLLVIINIENINKTNFSINSNNKIIDKNDSTELEINDTVSVTVLTSDFHTNDNNIFVYGSLEKKIN